MEDRTSSDTTVDEHQKAVLKCGVKGYPKPKVIWRREDGSAINLGLFGGQKYSGNFSEKFSLKKQFHNLSFIKHSQKLKHLKEIN